jgi:cation:H+ antiporter
MKKQTDLAIGNISGSNIFNILAVLSVPCMLAPSEFAPELLWRDYAFMLIMTLVLVGFSAGIAGRSRVGRIEGILLVIAWIGYLVTLYHSATV